MRLNVAFLVPPTAGHVNPTLPLVEELVARGHRVRYVTGPATLAEVKRAGAEPIEVPLAVPDLVVDRSGFSTTRMAEMLDRFTDDVRSVLPALVEALRADPPDVVCHDGLFFVGSSVAVLLGVPEIRLVPHFAENADVVLAPRLVPHGLDLCDARMTAFAMNSHLLGRSLGEPRDPAGVTTLVFIPRSFQIESRRFDDSFVFVGPEPPAAGRREPENLVYVALGGILNNRPDFYQLCVDAFAGTPWRVLMSVGGHVDPSRFDAPNIEVRSSFPQREVLRRAAVFVSHAGMNSLMEAMVEQVPVVALPLTAEQGLNAERLTEVGAGRMGDLGSLTATGLRELVARTVTDPRIADVLDRKFGARMSTGGARRAADVVESHGHGVAETSTGSTSRPV